MAIYYIVSKTEEASPHLCHVGLWLVGNLYEVVPLLAEKLKSA
jgi:hypothetical protein